MEKEEMYFGDDFGQKIDLTVRIREILRNYPGNIYHIACKVNSIASLLMYYRGYFDFQRNGTKCR
jgi:hypothetical protein